MPIPSISLTTIVDFIAAVGLAKVTVVRGAIRQYEEPYRPGRDYWRGLRDAMVEMQLGDGDLRALDAAVATASPKRRANYQLRAGEYRRWIGKKRIDAERVERRDRRFARFDVRINPELLLRVNDGVPTITKLYFRGEPLDKHRIDAALHLMETTYSDLIARGMTVGVLDIGQGRLITPTVANPNLEPLLAGELASFGQIWKYLMPEPDTVGPPLSQTRVLVRRLPLVQSGD